MHPPEEGIPIVAERLISPAVMLHFPIGPALAQTESNGCSLLEHSSTLISDRVCVPLPSEGGPLETY